MESICTVLPLNAWRAKLYSLGHTLVGRLLEDPICVCLYGDGDMFSVAHKFEVRDDMKANAILEKIKVPDVHYNRWLSIVSKLDETPSDEHFSFLVGPGSWMFGRLVKFEKVVIWSSRGLGPYSVSNYLLVGDGLHFSDKAMRFLPNGNELDSLLPRVIDVRKIKSYVTEEYSESCYFADIIEACFQIAMDGEGCFVADYNGSEVFWLDNDEIIYVSYANENDKEDALNELSNIFPNG